jgi:hypothetical protein
VDASDLYAYRDPLVSDIEVGVDVLGLQSLAGYRFVITNLPYREQAAILAHLLPIAARDGAWVAVLARSEWASATDERRRPPRRRALVHDNLHFAGEVRLTNRPVWVRPMIASPRHWFSWFVWLPEPRSPGRDAFLRFSGPPTKKET